MFGDHTVSLYKPKSPFFVATDGVKIISCNIFLGEYLYYTLEKYKPESQGYKRHYIILKNQSVFFTVCRNEQIKIGTFFETLDNLITLHQRKVELLKQIKKGYLQQMFPIDGENVPRVRFVNFDDCWEKRKLLTVSDIYSGRDYKNLYEGEIPVYGTGGIITKVDKALSYEKDAIGIGRKGTINKPFLLKAPFWTVDTLFYTIPKIDSELTFIFQVIQCVNWKQKDESTGVPSLSKMTISNTKVSITNLDEQRKIGNYFSKICELTDFYDKKNKNLIMIKKSYLQQMFI